MQVTIGWIMTDGHFELECSERGKGRIFYTVDSGKEAKNTAKKMLWTYTQLILDAITS